MSNKVLLCSIQKSGITWTQFLIFNYWNIKYNNVKKTLTYDELQEIHIKRRRYGFDHPSDHFPEVYHTHLSYDGVGFVKNIPNTSKFFNKFDKLIYIIRNPFDVMVSYYTFIFNRKKIPYNNNDDILDLYKLNTLEKFTEYYLEKWIHHVKSTRHRADCILNYDLLRKNPLLFKRAILLIDNDCDMSILKRAIKISSFENIRKMSIKTNRPYMRGGKLYEGLFCRDGRTGQYKEVMSKELIDYIKKRCEEEGLKI